MRIGIVSDIHGNIEGLDKALEKMGDVDKILCAGDAFDQFRFSNEVIERLQSIGAEYILGNHEEMLLSPAGARAAESKEVDKELLEWTRSRDYRFEMMIGDKRLKMFHSTPWDPRGEYVYPHSQALKQFAEADTHYAIYGHTHTQLARDVSGTLVINPGRDSRAHSFQLMQGSALR
ncbi:MAG: metallophosphoesterase family protein, partial [Pseudomonadales bacterium]|nr:metallophosphoesterase family protein [Pseudomonadales bacterium]